VREDSYVLVNIGLGWQHPNEKFGIRLQGENVTDEKYAIYGGSVAEADYFSAGTPATYSLILDLKF
jgi:outer membrane receptor protein involved in Fe transport